MKKRVVYGYLF